MKQKEAGIYRSEHFHSAGSVHFLTGVDSPDHPGCLSEGETLEDALENVNEAIIGCLKSRLKSAEERLKISSFERSLDNM